MLSYERLAEFSSFLAASRLDRDLKNLPGRRHLVAALRRPALLRENARFLITRTVSERNHIFVVGPPRSGTTLLAQILRAHPNIAGLDSEGSALFFRWNISDFTIEGICHNLMREFIDASTDKVQLFDKIASFACDLESRPRFMDKTPINTLKIPYICRHYPNSRIVFIVRDGRDGFLSAQRHPLLANKQLRSYARLWCLSVNIRMQQSESNHQIIDVRYEDLCAQSANEVRRIMSRLGEDFVETQICPTVYSKTRIRHRGGHERLEEPITCRSVGAWRKEMSSADLRIFHQIAGRELGLAGYEV